MTQAERREDLERETALYNRVTELEHQIEAIAKHFKLVVHPGHVDTKFGMTWKLPTIREICKECGK